MAHNSLLLVLLTMDWERLARQGIPVLKLSVPFPISVNLRHLHVLSSISKRLTLDLNTLFTKGNTTSQLRTMSFNK